MQPAQLTRKPLRECFKHGGAVDKQDAFLSKRNQRLEMLLFWTITGAVDSGCYSPKVSFLNSGTGRMFQDADDPSGLILKHLQREKYPFVRL